MHPLQRYLNESDETLDLFAKRSAIPFNLIKGIMSGQSQGNLCVLRRISLETGGVVSLDALISADQADHEPKPDQERGRVVDLLARRTSLAPQASNCLDTLNVDMVARALRAVTEDFISYTKLSLNHLNIAAEAAVNTANCLNGFSALHHHDQLVQALQPALAEILELTPEPHRAGKSAHKLAIEAAAHIHTAQGLLTQR